MLPRSAGILGIELGREAGAEIARRSRGTPRIANRLLRRVRDYAEVRADGVITRDIAKAGRRSTTSTSLGLDRLDGPYCPPLTKSFGGGPGRCLDAGGRGRGGGHHRGGGASRSWCGRAWAFAPRRGRVATAQAWTHLLTPATTPPAWASRDCSNRECQVSAQTRWVVAHSRRHRDRAADLQPGVPMLTAGLIVAALSALLHVYIFVMESLTWTSARTRATFGTSVEEAETTR